MLNLLSQPETYLSLLTLTAMEIVLGLDNIIFISILTGKLPAHQREKGRRLGLTGALVTRLALLSVMAWIASLTKPLFTAAGFEFSGKSLILLAGGLFLMFKATHEIHGKLEGESEHSEPSRSRANHKFWAVIAQIMLLDIVFSIDSVITAVGMAQSIAIMVTANILALGVMLLAGGIVGNFVEKHPTVKMLALSFLLMIGLVLVADGVGFHIPKGYIYFAMGFSVTVELLNLKLRKKSNLKSEPVHLHGISPEEERAPNS